MMKSWGPAVIAVHTTGRQSREKYIQSPMLSQSIPDYMMSQNRRPQSKSSLPRNPEISYSYPYIFAICYPD
jgi:hypothetical protein